MRHRFVVSLILLALAFPVHAIPYFPADPYAASQQWYLKKIDVYEAWSKTMGSADVVVAVIDTGVDIDHPDLKENIWTNAKEKYDGIDNEGNLYIDDVRGWDFVDGDNDPRANLNEDKINLDTLHHGTAVSGVIAAIADNGIGGAGVAPRVKIMPLRALHSDGSGNDATVMEAIKYAIAKNADVINLSFVTVNGAGLNTDLFLLLRHALQKGILVVAAVGNGDVVGIDLDREAHYPVCYSGEPGEDVVLGVAALSEDDTKPRFSNYGANCVDISAPGVNIFAPLVYKPERGLKSLFALFDGGSSFAAPQVAGVAALIKSLNPAYQADEIRQILLSSADPILDLDPSVKDKLGRGRLNARRALELAAQGGNFAFGSTQAIPYLLVAPASKALPEVTIMRTTGTALRTFTVYPPGFRGGLNVSSGDVDGDRISEIVTGAGYGGGPQVRVFTTDGKVVGSFFAYDKGFRGGVNVAVGDVDGDGRAEIVAGSGYGGGPQVRIFDKGGKVLGSFWAYDKAFRGGVQVTVADIDGDKKGEIIVAPGSGVGSKNEVRIFSDTGGSAFGGDRFVLKKSFTAFPLSVRGGINLAVGDLEGDGKVEIVVAPQSGVSPEVRIYSASGSWQRAFLVYPDTFLGGVNLAMGDLDRDGSAEIVVGPGSSGGPHVKIVNGFGQVKDQLFPYDPAFRGGVKIGIIKL